MQKEYNIFSGIKIIFNNTKEKINYELAIIVNFMYYLKNHIKIHHCFTQNNKQFIKKRCKVTELRIHDCPNNFMLSSIQYVSFNY